MTDNIRYTPEELAAVLRQDPAYKVLTPQGREEPGDTDCKAPPGNSVRIAKNEGVLCQVKGGPDITVIKEAEKDFDTWLIDVAHVYGWWAAHFRPAMTGKGWRTAVSADGAGFPDWIMLRRGVMLIVESKSESGTLSTNQERWREEFELVAKLVPGWPYGVVQYHLFRPRDRAEIEQILK